MKRQNSSSDDAFPACRSLIDPGSWQRIVSLGLEDETPDAFLKGILLYCGKGESPEFLPELARLEWLVRNVRRQNSDIDYQPAEMVPNPSLRLIEFHWKHLADYLHAPDLTCPEHGDEFVIIWKSPATRNVHFRAASSEDLLILKMAADDIDRTEVARLGAVPMAAVDAAMDRAAQEGIVLLPRSRIRRASGTAEKPPCDSERFFESPSFTLQWHLTQACDLHCRHCYDRSDRPALTIKQAERILKDLDGFCRVRHVKGQISFSGGNPLMHPDFSTIYRAAAERGFTVAILGNPTTEKRLSELISTQMPDFFQVSLEGLPEYNDFIRGKGHFEKTMRFLDLLRAMGVYSMVMLTLTGDNIGQVIPLGAELRDKADVFYFNRLSQVGEGALLGLPSPEIYAGFLEKYVEAAETNPVFGLKDNLINIVLHKKGLAPFGGCTGFGCGAAFNFLAVLSDGEVHACRKFPSFIGNILDKSLEEIYDSEIAGKYRSGCAACGPCLLKPVCGGCLACAFSHGLDLFSQKDPYCFL